ncbi:hypothetical protein CP533_0401 [Ophiocordyceps camponoti-saundersi (nom. inval.)]|nr:hypothetical protein CP533_0401 [Ophiocordyceps camponoti-saundersi (nom. inval.)]
MTTPNDSDDSLGWVFVRSRRRGRPQPARQPLQPPMMSLSTTIPPTISSSDTASDLAVKINELRSVWERESCCASLRRIVSSSACRVRRAVCLGIGTLAPHDDLRQTQRTGLLQLAAFTVMVKELGKISDTSIPCIFQEPLFTSVDREFLTSLGHEVVDTPEAFRHVSHDSFLFGIHLYSAVYAQALGVELPAMFVGTGWHVWESASLRRPSDLENLQTMDRSYVKAAFPQEPFSTAFAGTTIYWRPPTSPTSMSPPCAS